MLRIFRIAKIGRHNENLRILSRTMYASGGEITFMASLLSLSIIIFSTICYLGQVKKGFCLTCRFYFDAIKVESHETNTAFTSIPSTIWWSCITLTTVGYGDVIPQTPFGKLIAIGLFCRFSVIICNLQYQKLSQFVPSLGFWLLLYQFQQ